MFREKCVNFELAKKLKSVGFPQQKDVVEYFYTEEDWIKLSSAVRDEELSKLIAAPSLDNAKWWLKKAFGLKILINGGYDFTTVLSICRNFGENLTRVVYGHGRKENIIEYAIDWCCDYVVKSELLPKSNVYTENDGWINIKDRTPNEDGEYALFYIPAMYEREWYEKYDTVGKMFVGKFMAQTRNILGNKIDKQLVISPPAGILKECKFLIYVEEYEEIFWRPLPTIPGNVRSKLFEKNGYSHW